jgi:hypothetical protein
MNANTTQPIAPGMADEIAREMKGLRKKDLVIGIDRYLSRAESLNSIEAESLENLQAEHFRRYGCYREMQSR